MTDDFGRNEIYCWKQVINEWWDLFKGYLVGLKQFVVYTTFIVLPINLL